MQLSKNRNQARAITAAVALALAEIVPAVVAADDIAIDNYRLHIECVGQGSPAVILDAGLGGSSLEWIFVSERLSSVTKVCAFDRAGYGLSDMGPSPRTSSNIANELYLLLDGAGIDGPYVIVGHSFGGYNAQLFARRYPFLTAGLVLIDASHPQQVERFLAPPLNLLTAPSSRYGIIQFSEPPPPHARLPEAVQQLVAQYSRRAKTRRTAGNELLSFRDSAAQVAAAGALADLPLLVITRGKITSPNDEKHQLMEQRWLAMQIELASTSTRSVHLLATQSGHHIHIEQPDLVASGIAMLVSRHRWLSGSAADLPKTGASGPEQPQLKDGTWLSDSLNTALLPRPAERRPCADEGKLACANGAP